MRSSLMDLTILLQMKINFPNYLNKISALTVFIKLNWLETTKELYF